MKNILDIDILNLKKEKVNLILAINRVNKYLLSEIAKNLDENEKESLIKDNETRIERVAEIESEIATLLWQKKEGEMLSDQHKAR